MNVRDSEVIAGLLKTKNYKLTTDPREADVVIFNTCSVRQHAEEKVWSEIGRIAKLSPPDLSPSNFLRKFKRGGQIKTGGTTSPLVRKKIIGLVGCMAQNYKEDVFRRSPAVDFAVGPSDIHKIPEIIKAIQKRDCFALDTSCQGLAPRNCSPASGGRAISGTKSRKCFAFHGAMTRDLKIWETDGISRPEEIYHTGFYEDKDHAYVVISEGCSTHCSYCIVPFVRGELHNRDYNAILKEIREAVGRGIARITLLGQNVNAYNNFIELLKMVNAVKGLKEFTFITSHPKDTSTELFKAMAGCDKLKKNLHLPVQSGSNKILKLMNRGYVKEQYLDLAARYHEIIPEGALTTDIIVGFPGETEKDFLETYELMKKIKFDAAYIFKYSPRPRTEAEALADDVPIKEKERRHKILLDFQKNLHYENTDSHR